MSLSVKVCGITTLEDARFVAAAGADMLGFVHNAKSPRYVTAETAKAIGEWIYGPKRVGVFVNEALDEVRRIADYAALDYVQLHGNESPGYCRQVGRPVIKAFRVRTDMDVCELRARMAKFDGLADYFLLDTHHATLHGGTGQVFDWSVASALASEFPILLAGGIGPGNAHEAVATVNPAGIDCSSLLESEPGRKDFDRVTELFEALEPVRP